MHRIRLHGRGGQGVKTASRVLGSALFSGGYVVQDAQRYGAERRGAPIFAYVRAAHGPIHERGVIDDPNLVVVCDESLIQMPAAGVRAGLGPQTVLLVRTGESAETWRTRLSLQGPVIVLAADVAADEAGAHLFGIECAGAAARLLGVVSRERLQAAIENELSELDPEARRTSAIRALAAFDAMASQAGCVREAAEVGAGTQAAPDWVELEAEAPAISAPAIYGAATSVQVRTGLWRTLRPVIDHDRCHRCHWMCALPCPDSALVVDEQGYPQVDLEHCKGCMICVVQCPFHVISAVPERSFAGGGTGPTREEGSS
jgi:pyruvate ferredoxin oxidoreductase gamma subunit